MSTSTGFDYDVLISRLHGGMRAFQSLRAHRRERHREASPPSTRAPDPVTAPPPSAPTAAPPKLEPQGFVRFGDHVLPLFDAAAPPPAGPPVAPPPAVPPVTPPPAQEAAPVPDAPRPTPAATLKLPPPTPPARLGLVHSTPPQPGEARSPASPLDAASEAPQGPATEASLAARMRDEAARLEQVHAEHRACLALLLDEHRAELDARAQADAARAEADAARTTQVLRELLAEHRAELDAHAAAEAARMAQVLRDVLAEHRAEQARAAEVQAAQMAAVLARPRAASGEPGGSGDPLRAALTEQATLQREANEDMAQHITTLTTIVADIGQTVGLLAVAAFDGKQGRLPTAARPTFAPPPRPASPSIPDTQQAEAVPVADPVQSTTTSKTSERATADASPPRAAEPRGGAFLRDASSPAHLRAVAAAHDRARIHAFVGEVPEDDLLDDVDDDDGVRLTPLTPSEAQADG